MAIPTYEEAMLPILKSLSTGDSIHASVLREMVADYFDLTEDEREQRLSSNNSTVIQSRCAFAISYMYQAKLIERVSRGAYRITQRGFEALSERPEGLDSKYLMKFPEFADFIMRSNKTKSVGSSGSVDGSSTSAQSAPTQLDMTPLESIFNGHELIRKSLAQELLDRVHQKDPGFFERLVVDLLVAMGYGGAYGEAIQAMGQTGDGGIDGIIKEDRLGLDFIYVQAKRWQNTVGRPELQQFAGSLMGRKAAKGVFITTSGFSQTAKDFVASIQTRIVLVDGEMLANLMIDHGVGVSDQQVIHIRKLDEDYFEES